MFKRGRSTTPRGGRILLALCTSSPCLALRTGALRFPRYKRSYKDSSSQAKDNSHSKEERGLQQWQLRQLRPPPQEVWPLRSTTTATTATERARRAAASLARTRYRIRTVHPLVRYRIHTPRPLAHCRIRTARPAAVWSMTRLRVQRTPVMYRPTPGPTRRGRGYRASLHRCVWVSRAWAREEWPLERCCLI
jgi:hypothetical protein